MKRIGILGATGSIGTQTLQVIADFPDQFQVVALSAAQNMVRLAEQIKQFNPTHVCVGSAQAKTELEALLNNKNKNHPLHIEVGTEGLNTLTHNPEIDTWVIGLVGFIGLEPTLTALKQGKQVLTANKETLVVAGHLVQPYLQQIIPLDSEHSAIFQCLQGIQNPTTEIHRLFLTASGGPFRETPVADLKHVTPQQALQHPNWVMGQKVTIDSATMMNKGLETIEAHHLFGVSFKQIEVVIHPQSIVHSAVGLADGSILAQLGHPDMCTPIQFGLTYPYHQKTPHAARHLALTELQQLTFEPVSADKFPCLQLAQWAGEQGGTMPVVLNAADELAVEAFLAGKIGYLDIPKHIEALLKQHLEENTANPSLETIAHIDHWTRTAFEKTVFSLI